MTNNTHAKHHHLIPKTYMSAWEKGDGTLRVEYLDNPSYIKECNKKNIAKINNFHSICAGSPICTKCDTDLIFAAVKNYTVKYKGNVIKDTLSMNKLFEDFDNWEVLREDNTPVSKKRIRNEIEQVKITDIEKNWSIKYENEWARQVAIISNKILSATTNHINAFDKEYIMKFFTALDWRGFISNKQFEDELKWLCSDIIPLDNICIPEEKRVLPILTTAAEEMRYYILLKYYRQYLSDTGVIYQNAMINLKYTTFHFLIANESELFITSDTPAFVNKYSNNTLIGMLPITPKILLLQIRDSNKSGQYQISRIKDEKVQEYNTIIRKNADAFLILNW